MIVKQIYPFLEAKGIDKKNQEWVHGFFIQYQPNASKKDYVTGIIPDYASALYKIDIEPETVCFFTGVTDILNQKIFTNDICDVTYDGHIFRYLVIWDPDEQDFKLTNGKKDYQNNFQYLSCFDEIKIKGNRFDNPELLKYIGQLS